MDKAHKIQMRALLQSYRDGMDSIEGWNWVSTATKQDARLAVVQSHLEQLLVLLVDQEKLLD